MNRKFNIKDIPKLAKSASEVGCHLEMIIHLAQTDTLLVEMFKSSFSSLVNREIKKHCIVSYVSTIEVFCKRLVIEYNAKWCAKGYGKLLDANISLNEAYNLFKELKVSRASIISHYYTFQSLGAIASIFETLTNKAILDEIENIKEKAKEPSLLEINAEWRTELGDLFELRHRIIHEPSWKLNLEKVDIPTLSLITSCFCTALYKYCQRTKTFNIV